MMRFRIRNWRKYQKYKDRRPPWISVYVELLDDLEFEALGDATRWHVVAIFLLAARYDDPGKDPAGLGPELPYDPEWIRGRAGLEDSPDLDAIQEWGVIEVVTGSERNRNEDVTLAGAGASLPLPSVCVSGSSGGEHERGDHDPGLLEVLAHFNERFVRTFAPSEKVSGYLRERLGEGHVVEDCKAVIDLWADQGREPRSPQQLFATDNFNRALADVREAARQRKAREPEPDPRPVLEVDPEASDLWAATVAALAESIDPHSWDTWFRPTAGAQIDGGELVVLVPNEVFADWLTDKYSDEIEAALPEGMTFRCEVGLPAEERTERLEAREVTT